MLGVGKQGDIDTDGSVTGDIKKRSRKGLFGLLWPFIAVVLAQALIASASLYTLSAVRAYVGGESFWSKGQKDAIYFLTMYADSGERRYFDRFRVSIDVPLADREARVAMEAPRLDYDAAWRAFLRGGNSPADVPSLIWLYRNFKTVPYLAAAIERWIDADPQIQRLAALGYAIHARLQTGDVRAAEITGWKREIDAINETTTPLTNAFVQSFGEGSRAIAAILLGANVLTACLLILLAVWRTGKLLKQRITVESALTAERERAQITLASIGQAVVTVGADGRLDYMNEAAERLLDCSLGRARGKPLAALFRLVLDECGQDDHTIVDRLLAGESISASALPQHLYRPDWSSVAVSLVGAPLRVEGVVAGAVLVFHDMTKEQAYVSMLSWQATHDALTSLANRREFESRLQRALGALQEAGPAHGLMYLDLDQFKVVNDTCGHAAGDDLLRTVSLALARQLRPGDLLARLGGDEFGILLENVTAQTAIEAAERLRRAVQDLHFAWEGRLFAVTVSIGLVSLCDSATTLEETLRAADVACYMAKEKGRNRVQLHHPGDSETLQKVGEMAWVQRLHEALDQNRFRLHAQEIMALGDEAEAGAHIEVLLRLCEADGTLVTPGLFIPAAERYGLMPLIDRWVLRNAFDVLAQQQPGAIATCAINLSGATFSDDGFADFVRAQFDRTGIAPSTVCFEITETSAIADLCRAAMFIDALKALGCRFSLDDFGSGMSSFSYLKHLKVDYVKIDGSFVKDMLDDRIDRAMVEMIHHLGRVTGKRTIAEFVESEPIAQALQAIGIDYAQGYAIARPRPFEGPYVASAGLDAMAARLQAAWSETAALPVRRAG